MSPKKILNQLHQQGLVPKEQNRIIADIEARRPFSLHWELRSILYVGILMLSSGLGLLIYENYDNLGHLTILGGIGLLCVAAFGYAVFVRPPWTPALTQSKSPFGDYTLVLGCLLFLSLEGYAQYEYTLFGTRYGLVTILPALLFLALAYRFDHRGVLGMGLTALMAWVGVTVRPLDLYLKTNFFDERVIYSALALSGLVIGVALVLERQKIKPHFMFTYLLVIGNLLLVALLAGIFNLDSLRLLFAVGLAAACVAFDWYARREQSFLFGLMAAVYGYIGLTYLLYHYLRPNEYVFTFYLLVSGGALVIYLLTVRRKQ
jgi:hypothetical protein